MGLFDAFRGAWNYVTQPAPKTPPYPVTFEHAVGYGPGGYVNRYLNPVYFATAETATWVVNTFDALGWYERVAPGNEGPLYTASHKERWVVFPDGLEVNAGQIADVYKRNTTAGADPHANGLRAARDYIALARAEQEPIATIMGGGGYEEGGGSSGGGGGD